MIRWPILYNYIVREILAPFLLSLFVFTGILFLIRSLKLIDMIINKDVPAFDIVLLFSYIIPRFLEIALPMSLLLAVIIAFSRLSADSELVVIKATGISVKRLVLPVLFFAAIVAVLTFGIALWIRPWANYQLGVGMFQIAKTKASSGLVPGIFNEIGNLTIYARNIEQESKRLNSIIISDYQDEQKSRTFFAQNGHIIADNKTRTLTLRLYDGSIQEGFGANLRYTDFEVNNINISQDAIASDDPVSDGKKPNEMFFQELIGHIQDSQTSSDITDKKELQRTAKLRSEFHSRLALPLSCFCVAVIAMALGIQPSRGGKQWGLSANIAMGIVIIFVYYLLLAVGQAIAGQGKHTIWPFIWLPNFLFLLLAIFLYKQIGSERWLAVSETLTASIAKLFYALKVFDRNRGKEVNS